MGFIGYEYGLVGYRMSANRVRLNRSSIRAQALEKLAGYAAKSDDTEAIERLSGALGSHELSNDHSNLPMSGQEFEGLIALSKSASEIKNCEQAELLLRQLGSYLLEAPSQKYSNSPIVRKIEPSPWQLATKLLTIAVIDLGKAIGYSASADELLIQYIDKLGGLWSVINGDVSSSTTATENYGSLFALAFSFQGFLEGLISRSGQLSASFVETGILKKVVPFVDSSFLLKVETAVSSVAAKEDGLAVLSSRTSPLWLRSFFLYSQTGENVSAMLVNWYLSSLMEEISRAILITHLNESSSTTVGKKSEVLDILLDRAEKNASPKDFQNTNGVNGNGGSYSNSSVGSLVLDDSNRSILSEISNFSVAQVQSLDDGADYIELASPEKVALAFSVKSLALRSIGVANYFGIIPAARVSDFLESSIHYERLLLNHPLYTDIYKLGAYLCYQLESVGSYLSNSLPDFISNPSMTSDVAWNLAETLTKGLRPLSQDNVVSVIYTLINLLTPDSELSAFGTLKRSGTYSTLAQTSSDARGSTSHGQASDGLQTLSTRNIITAAVAIGATYGDSQIATLTSTVLSQKYATVNSSVDSEVIRGLALLAPHVNEKEFKVILRAFSTAESLAFRNNNSNIVEAISESRSRLAKSLTRKHPLFEKYLADLLASIVSKGDSTADEHHRSHSEISATAKEIAALLPPLATLLPKSHEPAYETNNWEMISLFRNAWFNMVVHGFSKKSSWTAQHKSDLEIIARSTPPLVSEASSNMVESELELNTVLRRGSSHHNVNDQKDTMQSLFSLHTFEVRSMSYPKLMFLSAAVLLESIRADTGDCSKVLHYFGDPDFRSGDTGKYMSTIATDSTKIYITNIIKGGKMEFTADHVAEQLKKVLILCCHRVSAVQNNAFASAELIIRSIPSALCKPQSLFALLDLMTLLWTSCLDAETDEYEPRTSFTSPGTNITLELSDSYEHRQQSLQRLLKSAHQWIDIVLPSMSFDLKSLLTSYLTEMGDYRPFNHVALGCTFALEVGGTISRGDGELVTIAKFDSQGVFTDTASGFLSQYIWRTEYKPKGQYLSAKDIEEVQSSMEGLLSSQHPHVSLSEMRDLLFKAATILRGTKPNPYIAQLAVKIPFRFFTEKHIEMGISLWLWIMNEVPSLRMPIIAQVGQEWEKTVKEGKGLFNRKYDITRPDFSRMEYAPSNRAEIDHDANLAQRSLSVHMILVRFLSSVFQASTYESRHLLRIFSRLLTVGLAGFSKASLHPFARSIRFELTKFALEVLDVHSRFSARISEHLKDLIITSALTWFSQPIQWPFGGNKLKLRADIVLLKDVTLKVANLAVPKSFAALSKKRKLLLMFLNDELTKMSAWLDPLQVGTSFRESFGKQVIKNASISDSDVFDAWSIDPVLAVYLVERYKESSNVLVLEKLVGEDPAKVISVPEALSYFLGKSPLSADVRRHILYWTPVSPIESINLFLPAKGADSYMLQYAMRSLESHDVNLTFFYVPQIVQSLRYDTGGYIEAYILETAKISQLFAHQIIWNILANSYKDEDSEVPDDMKPTLDRVVQKMTDSFNAEEKSFYEREFNFFNEVTSISGKLKPYIKKSKAEKKAKIDEEMAKIKLDVGVYLPSNPDGVVVAIDRKSGRPLQSHAKAPFLAKFKIKKELVDLNEDNSEAESDTASEVTRKEPNYIEVWQGAIFKVGDDCRQDVLALQIISVFRTIFKASGLDLYVFPYRVTATAPGCGVIDVLPNSISRDMLGREAVNGLYEYFTSKHGGEDSIDFQRARNNFVKSLAAYSVISYLIQFKDRHNGNLMYDSDGHILHIDFGFCFDIVPGGVKFEAAPFKLTAEMMAVMGGNTNTQAYRWFEELTIKAFLACRPYAETIIQVVLPMLDSGLPCFKGEATIRRLRARFALEKSEREAALHFKHLIKKSLESMYTKGYDEFQRITNGIPY
ncbi:1-phosphatidylinositol 4-kinase STT4 [Sugiyamaella lignohabitans]|uniref:1-phosphatidylinositol 4-kinase n=1 Tax=Sugiyamaella lignohabitans TaxID=796027 RepID=A0A167F2D2_9ASCO|nr:1-phosphatidylinositol 4-kinase STT4 [Sugiyamaella lignohabitans]ANB14735.1 1-phosphatidylinositol 4-kinase STT4 [Sugiyamaella lignohabitans]